MADRIQSFKVISKGGLQASENHLELAEDIPGAATRLVNYEVSLYGGYRRINGYEAYDTANPEVGVGVAEGKVLGVAIFKDDVSVETYVIAARKDVGSNTYSFYRHVPLAGWQKMAGLNSGATNRATVSGSLSVAKLRHATFNFGDGNRIIFVDGVNPPIMWDGVDFFELTVHGSGTSDHPGGNQLLPYPAVVEVFENHVFFGADEANLAIIAHSAPNDPFDFTANSGAGQLALGFDLVNFKPFRDNLFCFGANAINKVTPDLTAGFVIDAVTANVGCIARDSVLELGGDLVFLAPDGVRPVAGTSRIGDVELETISRSIQPILTYFSQDYNLDTLNGVVVRTKSQLRLFVGDDTINVIDSYGIMGGLRPVDTSVGWEFGELIGIRASCCTSGFVGREEFVIHGDYDGTVYRQEQGNSFDGRDIVAVYQTPYYDFGDTEVRKVLRKVNTYIRAEGPLTMNMSATYDWDDNNAARPVAYSQESKGAPNRYGGRGITYAGPNIVYGGSEKPIIVTSIQGSGFAVQLTYVTLGTDAPFSIQGIVFEFSVSGRR